MMQIISRSHAKSLGLKRYFTSDACLHGHVAERSVRNGECLECAKKRLHEWRQKNPDVVAKHRKNHRILNRDREFDTVKKWKLANPEKANILRIKKNIATREWIKNNQHKHSANEASRRASKSKRTPSWLNDGHFFEIDCIYKYCASLKNLGLDYHVDHIVPLQGQSVSGLHTPWNLQVIPASENLRKGNRYHADLS